MFWERKNGGNRKVLRKRTRRNTTCFVVSEKRKRGCDICCDVILCEHFSQHHSQHLPCSFFFSCPALVKKPFFFPSPKTIFKTCVFPSFLPMFLVSFCPFPTHQFSLFPMTPTFPNLPKPTLNLFSKGTSNSFPNSRPTDGCGCHNDRQWRGTVTRG